MDWSAFDACTLKFPYQIRIESAEILGFFSSLIYKYLRIRSVDFTDWKWKTTKYVQISTSEI